MINNFIAINFIVFLCVLADVYCSFNFLKGGDPTSPKQSQGLFGETTKPNDPNIVLKGKEFFKEGQFHKAVEAFTGAIRKFPKEPSYYVLRARCYVRQKILLMALTDFKIAKSLITQWDEKDTPILVEYLTYLGNEFLKVKVYKDAHWCFTESININPSILLYKMKGDSYRGMADFENAILEYKEALKIDQKDDAARKALILSLCKVEKFDEAITNIFELNEKDIAWWGEVLYGQDRLTEALRCFNKAIERNPEDEHYFELRGKTHVKLGSINLAISDFNSQTKLSPAKLNGWFFLVDRLHRLGRTDEIIKGTQVLNNTQLGKLGKLFLDKGRLHEALPLFNGAIKQNSSVALHFKQRGLCHSIIEKWNLAISDLRKGIQIDPNCEDMYLYRSALSESLYETGEYEEAVKEIILASEAVRSTIHSRFVREKLNKLANKLSSHNEYALAIRCYTTLMMLNKSFYEPTWECLLQRGICHRKIRNYDEAILDNMAALQEIGWDRNDSFPILFDLFELLIDAERYEEALGVVELVETAYPHLLDFRSIVNDSSSRIIAARNKIRMIPKKVQDGGNSKGRDMILSAISKAVAHYNEQLIEIGKNTRTDVNILNLYQKLD